MKNYENVFFKAKSLDLVSALDLVDDVVEVLGGWGRKERTEVYQSTLRLIPVTVRAQNNTPSDADDSDADADFHGWEEAETPM